MEHYGRNFGTDLTTAQDAAPPAVWDTRQVSPRKGFSYYREGLCQSFMALNPESNSHHAFSARIERYETSTGVINYAECTPHFIVRSDKELQDVDDRYLHLNYQITGQICYDLGSQEIYRPAGSLFLFDAGKPVNIRMKDSLTNSVLSVLLPKSILNEALGSLDQLSSFSDFTHAGIMKQLMAGLRHSSNAGAYNTGKHIEVEHLFRSLTSVLTASLLTQNKDNGDVAGRTTMDEIEVFTRLNLSNPELSAQTVASNFGISRRYLDKMFSHKGQTFTDFLRCLRIEHAALDLITPTQIPMSITEIAFRWGFSDLSTFNRAFKRRYGETPSSMRAGR